MFTTCRYSSTSWLEMSSQCFKTWSNFIKKLSSKTRFVTIVKIHDSNGSTCSCVAMHPCDFAEDWLHTALPLSYTHICVQPDGTSPKLPQRSYNRPIALQLIEGKGPDFSVRVFFIQNWTMSSVFTPLWAILYSSCPYFSQERCTAKWNLTWALPVLDWVKKIKINECWLPFRVHHATIYYRKIYGVLFFVVVHITYQPHLGHDGVPFCGSSFCDIADGVFHIHELPSELLCKCFVVIVREREHYCLTCPSDDSKVFHTVIAECTEDVDF